MFTSDCPLVSEQAPLVALDGGGVNDELRRLTAHQLTVKTVNVLLVFQPLVQKNQLVRKL
jgi:hypothetical protein